LDDFIMKTGDMIQITITPPAIVPMLAAPVPLVGSSTSVMVNGAPACLLGDELPMAIAGPLPYTAPPFVTPGMGTVSVTLTPTNQTVQSQNGKAILIKGQQFVAKFTVTAPAMQPTPGGPVPDPVATKPGTAQFITTTVNAKAG
jgi:Contractile injection system spike tip protein